MNQLTQLLVLLLAGAVVANAACKCKGNEEQLPETNPCDTVRCGYGATCELVDGRPNCVCPSVCPDVYQPICGSDGKTYGNSCNLRVANCKNKRNVVVEHEGQC